MKFIWVIAGFLILIGSEVLRVYYIMPFPGSQVEETLPIAYFLHNYILYFRILGWLFLVFGLIKVWSDITLSGKIIVGILFAFYLFVALLFNYYFVADKIFYQPRHKNFLPAQESKIDPRQLVIGVSLSGEAKAYPIEIIGYHHQVRDTIGGQSVMITYCTVCRTGRVYSPLVEGREEEFRLVGMDHFNAMFEDQTTKSWWRQVNGEAIIGPEKGKSLTEIPSAQMTLSAWLEQYPDSQIMQPDSLFKQGYADLKLYDEGTLESGLERRDTLSWKDKSWIVGVQLGETARAYDWNTIVKSKVITDTLSGQSLLLTLENDSATFHVFAVDTLRFSWNAATEVLHDANTNSSWKLNGLCVNGTLQGKRLSPLQSYQEFWHSWKTFRPHTSQFR